MAVASLPSFSLTVRSSQLRYKFDIAGNKPFLGSSYAMFGSLKKNRNSGVRIFICKAAASSPSSSFFFPDLDADDFRHPLDKQNTLLLRAIPHVNEIVKTLLECVKAMDNDNNGHGVIAISEIALRATVLCITLLAAVLASVDLETYNFFVTFYCWILKLANAIVCLYMEGSLILSVIYHIKKVRTEFPIFLPFDIFMSPLLLSSAIVVTLGVWDTIGLWDVSGYSILMTFLGYFVYAWLMYVATLSHTKQD